MEVEDEKSTESDELAEGWSSLTLTRTVKENHGKDMTDVVMCPVDDCTNLCATAGGNQLCVYDTAHRGNFVDLSHCYLVEDCSLLSVCWPHSATHSASELVVCGGDSLGRVHLLSIGWALCRMVVKVCESAIIQMEPISGDCIVCISRDGHLFEVLLRPASECTRAPRKIAELRSDRFALDKSRQRFAVADFGDKRLSEYSLASGALLRSAELKVPKASLGVVRVVRADLKYLDQNRVLVSATGGLFQVLDLDNGHSTQFRIGHARLCDPPLFDVHLDGRTIAVACDSRNSAIVFDTESKTARIELTHSKKKTGMTKAVFTLGKMKSLVSISRGALLWKWDEPALVRDFFHTASFFDDYSLFAPLHPTLKTLTETEERSSAV